MQYVQDAKLNTKILFLISWLYWDLMLLPVKGDFLSARAKEQQESKSQRQGLSANCHRLKDRTCYPIRFQTGKIVMLLIGQKD